MVALREGGSRITVSTRIRPLVSGSPPHPSKVCTSEDISAYRGSHVSVFRLCQLLGMCLLPFYVLLVAPLKIASSGCECSDGDIGA